MTIEHTTAREELFCAGTLARGALDAANRARRKLDGDQCPPIAELTYRLHDWLDDAQEAYDALATEGRA